MQKSRLKPCYNVISHEHSSGGVGSPAGPTLAGALFDGVMNINIELLMGATGPPHFTRHCLITYV